MTKDAYFVLVSLVKNIPILLSIPFILFCPETKHKELN